MRGTVPKATTNKGWKRKEKMQTRAKARAAEQANVDAIPGDGGGGGGKEESKENQNDNKKRKRQPKVGLSVEELRLLKQQKQTKKQELEPIRRNPKHYDDR